MEPNFRTSFIPKKPIVSTQSVGAPVIKTTNILSLVSNIVFVVVILVSGGLFFYKNLLSNQIVKAGEDLEAAKGAFQLDKIQELIDVNARLMATNNLLDQHIAVSELLLFLQEVTVKNVRFDDFVYKNEISSQSIKMKAEGMSYNALASQGDIFSKNEFIKNPYFYDFTTMDNGYIQADFSSNIDPTLVSYKKMIDSLSSVSAEVVVPKVESLPLNP